MNASAKALTMSVALAAIAVVLAQPARAQVSAPPTHDTLSPTGVSYANGSLNWQEQDLSIGGEDGLSLNRIYLSTSADGNFAPGWTHNLFSLIRNQPVPTPPDIMPPPPQFQAWSFNVIVGNATYIFVDLYRNQHVRLLHAHNSRWFGDQFQRRPQQQNIELDEARRDAAGL
jgi:hypothetical protein